MSQYKITSAVLDAWSEILRRTPNSKLLLANRAMSSECNRDYMIAEFARREISSDRVLLKPPAEHFEYLQYYNQIDIALDAFPWNGGTTTTEAIWQGVPVLTFVGDRWASRTSRTLLMSSHLSDFVASDERAFVDAAVAWGNDLNSPQKLLELRLSMRGRLQATLCKMDQMVHSMESIYMELSLGSSV